MTLLNRVNEAKTLWRLLAPSCPAPDDAQLARWLNRFTDSEMEFAIRRTGAKVRRGFLAEDATAPFRFCTGVLMSERRAAEQLHRELHAQ